MTFLNGVLRFRRSVSSARSNRASQFCMMGARRMALTQAIAEEVNMAVTRQQGVLLNSLQTIIDLKLSIFQQNIQHISNLQLNRIEMNNVKECKSNPIRTSPNESEKECQRRQILKLKFLQIHVIL